MMYTSKAFKSFKASKKIQHLMGCKNRAIVWLNGGNYTHIQYLGNAWYQVTTRHELGYRTVKNVFSIGVVYDTIKELQPDMRKWRMS